MRHLFLDMDGVLVTHASVARARERFPDGDDPKHRIHWIDRDCMARLNTVVHEFGFSVVLSSTWRLFWWELMDSTLRANGAEFGLVGRTPEINQCRHRGVEILHWAQEHGVAPEDLVILDDDNDMEPYLHRLVRTSMKTGFDDAAVAQLRTLF